MATYYQENQQYIIEEETFYLVLEDKECLNFSQRRTLEDRAEKRKNITGKGGNMSKGILV